MKSPALKTLASLTATALACIQTAQSVPAPIAGVDFDDGLGGNSDAPDDLNPGDSITVSTVWTSTGAGVTFDVNSNTGRDSEPVGKIDGPQVSGEPPLVGDAPPEDGIHSFSITVGATPIALTRVTFDFSKATPGANRRWVAFRTSLDENLIFSEEGPARPSLTSVDIPLNGALYEDIANTTVDFIFYSGGEGTGDCDIDSIVIEAEGDLSDTDGDGLPDSFEQLIIDSDENDAINTLADVLPGDDFDSDDSSNEDESGNRTDPTDPDTDDDGYRDGIETNDGTFDDINTDTGTDPLMSDTDMDGLPDGVETNDGTFDDAATDTGSNPLVIDTEGDTMDDRYEVDNGLDPNVDDTQLDPDLDLSNNLNEFNVGTDPQNPDTDGDDYIDGVETNDGTFDNLATDTGTDPLDPDTDNDTLPDGAETNTGVFVSETDRGTNPLAEDTDSDNFRDGAEINIHGTDPLVAGSFPRTALSALFLGGNADGNQGSDDEAIRFMQDKYGISNITYMQANTTDESSEDNFDLLVLSSTPGSGDIRGKFEDSLVPIVNWEEAVSDDGTDGEFGMAEGGLSKSGTTTEIAMTGHPIGTGLPATVVLFDSEGPETTNATTIFPGLTSAGNAVNGTVNGGVGPLGTEVAGRAMILVAEAGDAVSSDVGTPNDTAPARRVMMPWTDNSIRSLTPDGLTLFGNALDWAAGRLGAPDTLRIVNYTYEEITTPVPNKIVTLEWASTPGTGYFIHSSSDFAVPIANRSEVDDTTGAEGASTTTLVIDFNLLLIPLDEPRMFFVVRENTEQ